jgi:hypothetical protein
MGNQTNPTSDQQHELEDLRDPMSVPDMVHVVISTREEELLWAVFDGFSEPNYLIIDMALLENEPMDLITLANLSDCRSHIVALTDHPVFEIGARFGKARLTFLQKPVSAHDLLLLLRLRIVDDAEEQADVC